MDNVFAKLSAREKRLAVLTLLVLAGAACVMLGLQAHGHVARLDGKIAQLEQELLNLAQQNAQRSAVDAAYQEVVATHSSEMTKEEIHDNLRREIFSLAKPTFPGEDGQPDRQIDLVKIPTLREGVLKDEGEGYREYQVQFRILPTHVRSLMWFLWLVETSNQILRIDGLDLGRPLKSGQVHATVVITRTVLDSPDAVPQRGGAGTGARVTRSGSI